MALWAFAETYKDEQFVQQIAGQIPWYHNVIVFTKLKEQVLREWYIRACLEHGWSRAVLEAQLVNRLLTNSRRHNTVLLRIVA